MQPLRRKTSFFNSEIGFAMKGRKNNNLSILVVVFSVFLFGIFMYNEDVKSIAEFPFSRNKAREIQEGKTDPEEKVPVPVVSDNLRAETEKTEEDLQDSEEKQEPIEVKQVVAKDKEEDGKIELPAAVKEEEEEEDEEEEQEVIELPPEDCDLFTGEWVFDNVTRPLYREEQCEFLTAQVTCLRNGRRDSLYQNWRWQPRDCNLPK